MLKQTLLSVPAAFGLSTVLAFSALAQTSARDAAFRTVVQKVFVEQNESMDGKQIYGSRTIVSASNAVDLAWDTLRPKSFDAWLFFIDDHPLANWSHPVRYVYVNTQTNAVSTVHKKTPPKLDEFDLLVEAPMPPAGPLYDFSDTSHMTNGSSFDYPVENKYAVIISGGGNKFFNYERYWNDCSAIYQALTTVYGYKEENIFVLMGDGTDPADDLRLLDNTYVSSDPDLDGDGDDDIRYAATPDNIALVFNKLSNKLSHNDFLFVYTTDHGDTEGGHDATLILWHDTMTDDAFAAEVDKVTVGEMSIIMEQCYSGGFIDDLRAPYRTIATAARHDEVSWARADGRYNEFVYHWTAAAVGAEPDGTKVDADRDADGKVSMYEAFNYARNEDQQNEHPQFNSMPFVIGVTGTL